MSLLYIILLFVLFRIVSTLFNGGGGDEAGRSSNSAEHFYRDALLKVMATAMKADGRVVRSELDVVKTVLVRQFGEDGAKSALLRLRELLQTNFDARTAAMNIGAMLPYADRLRIADVLCQIAEADGIITETEVQTVVNLSYYMGLSAADTQRIASRLRVNGGERGWSGNANGGYGQGGTNTGSATNAYATLGVKPDATNSEVKDAYRALVKKYHPDRYATKSAGEQAQAEQKFKEVQAAYEQVKKSRGL